MRKWYPALLVAVMIVVSAIAYPHLPNEVPRHWSVRGEPNAYWSRGMATIAGPLMLIVIWASLRVARVIDPRRQNYERMRGTYELMIDAVLTLIAVMHLAALAYALGLPIDVGRVVPAAIGAALIVVGNVMPRARPNWWFGIRTPWTLSNDRVWEKTHRFGGYVMTAAGLVAIAAAVLGLHAPTKIVLATVIAAGLSIVIYSYLTWTRETSR